MQFDKTFQCPENCPSFFSDKLNKRIVALENRIHLENSTLWNKVVRLYQKTLANDFNMLKQDCCRITLLKFQQILHLTTSPYFIR